MAQEFLVSKNGSCFNYQDYDTHSTPSRDSNFIADYRSFNEELSQLKIEKKLTQADSKLVQLSQDIFSKKRSALQNQRLESYCNVIAKNRVVHLGSFWDALKTERASFHPNDNILRRWGFINGKKTQCKEHYGYPVTNL